MAVILQSDARSSSLGFISCSVDDPAQINFLLSPYRLTSYVLELSYGKIKRLLTLASLQ